MKSLLLTLTVSLALGSLAPALADDATTIKHSFLATGGRTFLLTEDGKVKWSMPESSRDGWVLPNGNLLITIGKCKKYPGGGVEELSTDGKVVFSYRGTQSEVDTSQRLPSGNTLITESGPKPRLMEITPQGKVAVEFPLACQKENFHMQTRMARKLPSGNYLCPHLLDFAVKEYTPQGKVVRVIPTDARGRDKKDWPFTAIQLKNGNILIGCTNGNRVIEVDKDGKIDWELTNDDLEGNPIDDACGIQRLPNGNTVITSYHAKGDMVKLTSARGDPRQEGGVEVDKGGKAGGIPPLPDPHHQRQADHQSAEVTKAGWAQITFYSWTGLQDRLDVMILFIL